MTRQIIIDTSIWAGSVNWQKAKSAGAAGMYTKASQLSADPTFAANWNNCKGVLPRGAFCFMDFHLPELASAKLFTDTLGKDWGELPPALDLEQNPALFGLSAKVVQVKVYNWLQAVEKTTGRIPAIYAGYYWWIQWMNPDPSWARYPFWLPWYASESIIRVPPPWTHWSMWQYTGNGPGPQYGTQGLSLDMSYCDNLPALLSGVPIPPPAPAPVPVPGPASSAYITLNAVNVRSANSQYSQILGIMPKDTVVYIAPSDYIPLQYSHFQATTAFPQGGFIATQYLQKKA